MILILAFIGTMVQCQKHFNNDLLYSDRFGDSIQILNWEKIKILIDSNSVVSKIIGKYLYQGISDSVCLNRKYICELINATHAFKIRKKRLYFRVLNQPLNKSCNDRFGYSIFEFLIHKRKIIHIQYITTEI